MQKTISSLDDEGVAGKDLDIAIYISCISYYTGWFVNWRYKKT